MPATISQRTIVKAVPGRRRWDLTRRRRLLTGTTDRRSGKFVEKRSRWRGEKGKSFRDPRLTGAIRPFLTDRGNVIPFIAGDTSQNDRRTRKLGGGLHSTGGVRHDI